MDAFKWPSLSIRRDEHVPKLVRKCIDGDVLNILITILFSISTFVLAQTGRAIFYICLQQERKQPVDLFIITEVRILINTVDVHKFEDTTMVVIDC